MTEEERQDFLAEARVAVMAIEQPDGPPLAVPIWYLYQPGSDIRIVIGPHSTKATLLAQAGRFSLCVQTETVPYRYVSVSGPVVETRQCDIESDARVLAHRYLGSQGGDRFIEAGDESSSICVTMRPEKWYSADYGKVQ